MTNAELVSLYHSGGTSSTDESQTEAADSDASLTDKGRRNAQSEGEKFYNDLQAGTRKPFHVFISSPSRRSVESQAHLMQAQNLWTGKKPNLITVYGLRESAPAGASRPTAGQTYSGPVISGTATTDDDEAWGKLKPEKTDSRGRWKEKSLDVRAEDVGHTLYHIAWGIHQRTGESECSVLTALGRAPD